MRDLCGLLGRLIESPVGEALIAELGEREVKTVVDRHYFKFQAEGLSLATDDAMTIRTICLYGREREDYQRYARDLPHGLQWDWDRRRVQAVRGRPSTSGGCEETPFYGRAAQWDRYDLPTYSLHLEYRTEGQGILLVTLSTRLKRHLGGGLLLIDVTGRASHPSVRASPL
jgi:hypothetical protein